MKIAVTGAGGFVGGHVVRTLSRWGHDVVAAGRNIERLKGDSERVEPVQFDLARAGPECFAQIGAPDALVHLAWSGLANYRSLHHFEEELPAHYRFLKKVVQGGLRALVVSGTCFEYGLQSGPLSEDMAAQPCNPYGFAKDALRRQLEFLARETPFNLTWARLFYLYGQGQAETSLFTQLRRAAERGEAAFDMSGGEQLRDYLPVEEAARLLARLATNARPVGVVNVCSGKPVSVRGLAEQWLEENGWSVRLNRGRRPYPDYEPMAFWGDRSRLDSILRDASREAQRQ
jgi:nucleoside-diphosphate-sugar epimerase